MTENRQMAIVAVSCVFLYGVIRFAYEKPHFSVNRCRAQIYFLRGGYRSMGVDYCDGFYFNPDGSEHHLYHRPKLFYTDVKQYLTITGADFEQADP
jgi:hypothetical protein